MPKICTDSKNKLTTPLERLLFGPSFKKKPFQTFTVFPHFMTTPFAFESILLVNINVTFCVR